MKIFGDQDLDPLPQEEKHIKQRRAMFDVARDRRTMGKYAADASLQIFPHVFGHDLRDMRLLYEEH